MTDEEKTQRTLAHIATSLNDIARQLGRIANSVSLLTSLEGELITLQTEIVEDIRNRRIAERASYLAFHRAYAEAEEYTATAAKKVLPEEQPA